MERSKNPIPLRQTPWLASLMVLLMLVVSAGCEQGGLRINGSPPTQAQLGGQDMALALRKQVVSIVAEGGGRGWVEHGFGFIVGKGEEDLFVVTANHVVRRSDEPDNVAKRVTVKYFHDQGRTHEAALLETSDPQYDLAVLRAKVPDTLRGEPLGPQGQAREGLPVWFIGRAKEWFVPPSPGEITAVTLDRRIHAGIASVQPGTSGAPLVAESGVIGMIIKDSGVVSEAVSIDIIKDAFARWNLPWDLGRGEEPMKLAVFPWYETGSAANYRHMVREALDSVLNETTLSPPIVFSDDPRVQQLKGVNKIWTVRSGSPVPDVDLISRLGKELKVNTVLIFSLDIIERASRDRLIVTAPRIEVFLIDVEKRRKAVARGSINDFIQDRFTEVRRLTKGVFADHKRGHLE